MMNHGSVAENNNCINIHIDCHTKNITKINVNKYKKVVIINIMKMKLKFFYFEITI